jgi:restriction system protein
VSSTGPEYHYPPDLFALVEDALTALFKGKQGMLIFFRGAGVPVELLEDLENRLQENPDSIRKIEIARTILRRLNEGGDRTLRARREVLRRVTETEDFSSAWPADRERAENLVGRIRHVTNAKDALTRIEQEREAEVGRRRREAEQRLREQREKDNARDRLRRDLAAAFAESDPHRRGKLLEPVLGRLFEIAGARVREAFEVRVVGEGVIEQIDGIIELDGDLYLVEVKWYKDRLGTADIAQALVRIFSRAGARGIILSASGFSDPAVTQVADALAHKVIVLCELEEVVSLLERGGDPVEWLRQKIHVAIAEKRPLHRPKSAP